MVIREEGPVYHVSSASASYIISVKEEWGGVALRGSLVGWGWGGGDPAVAVSTQKETAVVAGRVNVKSVSLLWSVMSALQL